MGTEIHAAPSAAAGGADAAGPSTVYALFLTGGFFGLEAYSIDGSTGAITNKVPVKGMDDNPADETTREFLFDPDKLVFYYLDANFTAGGGDRPSKGREIYLYTIDAKTGKASKQTVTGATDYPTGQSIGSAGDIIMATEAYTADVQSGWNYYSVNPATGKALLVGSVARGASEDDDGFYAGYHRVASKDGKTLYRLGYKKVTVQQEQGLDIISPGGKTAKWIDEISPGHDYYMTANRFDAADGEYIVSLAPNKADSKRGLDIVQWSPSNPSYTPSVLAVLGNAHPPAIAQLGMLGYLGSFLKDDFYVAMVVDNSVPARWALATFDIQTKQSAVLPLTPLSLSGTMGMSGLGFA